MKTSERAKYSNIQQRRGTEATNKSKWKCNREGGFRDRFLAKTCFQAFVFGIVLPHLQCNSHQQVENLSPKEAVSLALDKRKGGVGRFS